MSRVSGTGSYGNAFVQREETEFDIDTRRRLDGLDPLNSEKFEKWAPERQKEAYEGFVRADSTRIEQKANADRFVALHKEFVDIDTNGQTMNRTLEALYGDRLYSVAEFEKAYAVCRANGSLTIDLAEEAKQRQAVVNQRAKAAREQRAAETRVLSETEKENMSLEELREAENREIRRRMQEAGERGGNGW